MKTVMGPFSTQVASDIIRDGMGVELLAKKEVVAEIFRCDAKNTMTICTFENEIPLVEIERLIRDARRVLKEFEDGSPLPITPHSKDAD